MSASVVATLFALAAAFTWGTGDFIGGLSSRRLGPLHALMLSYIFGFLGLLSLALFTSEALPNMTDLFWGAFSGVVGLVGFLFLLQGFAVGRMGVVAPLSAILSAAIPVAFTALRLSLPSPTQLYGFAVALFSIWLISRKEAKADRPTGIVPAILAGLGFSGFFIALDQISDAATFWPLVAGRLTALSLMLIYSFTKSKTIFPAKAPWKLLVPMGLLDVIANYFFLISIQAGRLDITSVLVSLYPAITVLLARLFIKEQLTRWQVAGVVLAVFSVMLISL